MRCLSTWGPVQGRGIAEMGTGPDQVQTGLPSGAVQSILLDLRLYYKIIWEVTVAHMFYN